MNHTVPAILSALAVVALVVFVGSMVLPGEVGTIRPSLLSSRMLYTGAPLSQEYTNHSFRFTVSLPEGFTAHALPVDEAGGTAITLQSTTGEGIQIYVVPVEENLNVLTAEDIRASITDLVIEAPEPVDIGAEYRGVAFLSNNEAFGGASREVWFYFRGNLYQISTYAQFDTLLQAIFATWTFF